LRESVPPSPGARAPADSGAEPPDRARFRHTASAIRHLRDGERSPRNAGHMTHTYEPAVTTTTVTDEDRADTRDMLVVHTAFRREFRLLPGLIRRTTAGDLKRAGIIAAHLDLITDFLHRHHGGEDRLLWPRLLSRVDDSCAPVVLLMEAQHEKISAQLDEVQQARAAYTTTAGADDITALAAACDRLHALLDEHLATEEQRLLPIAAQYISAAEWADMGEEGFGSLPKRQVPIAFGMMSYQGDPEVLKAMLAAAPPPVRLLMPRLAGRAFRRYSLRIHGTPTP
jgi:hemerythrin-like domain-containing protein